MRCGPPLLHRSSDISHFPISNPTNTSATPAETAQASLQMDTVPTPPSLPATPTSSPPTTTILTTSRSVPILSSRARTNDQSIRTPHVLECRPYQLGLQDALEGRRYFKALLSEVPSCDLTKITATSAPAEEEEVLQFLGDYEAGWREGKGLRTAYGVILVLVPVLIFVWAASL